MVQKMKARIAGKQPGGDRTLTTRRSRGLGIVLAAIFSAGSVSTRAAEYFPPLDDQGGWRALRDPDAIRRVGGFDQAKLDDVFHYLQGSTKNGGLLVVRHGWLVYERYFGLGHREASPTLASCGKSFTSVAVGILMAERPELFPDGLDQRVFTPALFPPETFPLSDSRKAGIKLGQLLTFSAGIRGNNPAYVHGRPTTLDPIGPDGWEAMVDAVALGQREALPTKANQRVSATTLWCAPGEGYSYASASIHLASIMLRHVTGLELRDCISERLAGPLGWGRWSFGYNYAAEVSHAPGAGGIALRATDMLRFGYLRLQECRWQDRQLVPDDHVKACGRTSPYNPHYPSNIQFDVNTNGELPGSPRDAFWKSGSGGQVLYMVPSLELVGWKQGGRDGQYSERDTGLPSHPDAVRDAPPRGEGRETIDADTAGRATLERVKHRHGRKHIPEGVVGMVRDLLGGLLFEVEPNHYMIVTNGSEAINAPALSARLATSDTTTIKTAVTAYLTIKSVILNWGWAVFAPTGATAGTTAEDSETDRVASTVACDRNADTLEPCILNPVAWEIRLPLRIRGG